MSVLVYTESDQGNFKKLALEVASYGKAVANQLGTTVTAVSINNDNAAVLGNYGVDKVLPFSDHADFDELLELVQAVKPQEIYCTHGFDKFVNILRSEGFRAYQLEKDVQMALDI